MAARETAERDANGQAGDQGKDDPEDGLRAS